MTDTGGIITIPNVQLVKFSRDSNFSNSSSLTSIILSNIFLYAFKCYSSVAQYNLLS